MAIAYLTGTAAGGTTTSVTTSGVDTTGANLIVLAVGSYNATPSTISDSKGNTWTPLTTRGSGTIFHRLYYCYGPTVGSGHTFTASHGGSAFPGIAVAAFSGAASSPFDQESGSATSASPGSITPTNNNELLVAGLTWYPGGTVTINGGFTIAAQQNYVSGTTMGTAIAYLIQTSKTAAGPTWSGVSFSERASAMVAFKAAAASGNRRRRVLLCGGDQ